MNKLLRKFKLISRDDVEFMTYRFNFNPLYSSKISSNHVSFHPQPQNGVLNKLRLAS